MSYVLVHGGGSTGRYWDRVVPLLDRPALAPDLPGRGGRAADLGTLTVDDEVAAVVADVAAADLPDPLVLVAHSSGGLVVPGVVAALGGRVAHVVLSAALVPPEGGCGLDCLRPDHRAGLEAVVADAATRGEVITLPGAPEDPERFRSTYGGDPLDDDELAFLTDPLRCVPDTVHHYWQPIRWSGVAGTPITYVLNEQDRPVRPESQEEMAARLPAPTTILRRPGGHVPAVTDTEAFASIVRAAHPT